MHTDGVILAFCFVACLFLTVYLGPISLYAKYFIVLVDYKLTIQVHCFLMCIIVAVSWKIFRLSPHFS